MILQTGTGYRRISIIPNNRTFNESYTNKHYITFEVWFILAIQRFVSFHSFVDTFYPFYGFIAILQPYNDLFDGYFNGISVNWKTKRTIPFLLFLWIFMSGFWGKINVIVEVRTMGSEEKCFVA